MNVVQYESQNVSCFTTRVEDVRKVLCLSIQVKVCTRTGKYWESIVKRFCKSLGNVKGMKEEVGTHISK